MKCFTFHLYVLFIAGLLHWNISLTRAGILLFSSLPWPQNRAGNIVKCRTKKKNKKQTNKKNKIKQNCPTCKLWVKLYSGSTWTLLPRRWSLRQLWGTAGNDKLICYFGEDRYMQLSTHSGRELLLLTSRLLLVKGAGFHWRWSCFFRWEDTWSWADKISCKHLSEGLACQGVPRYRSQPWSPSRLCWG